MNNRDYSGPSAAGIPKNATPDWLDHTGNAKADYNVASAGTFAEQDPGPNAQGAETDTTIG